MKRYLSLLLSAVFLVAMAVPAAAARPDIRFPVTFNGHPVIFTDAQPEIVNDRTFVPFRTIFEKMGATIEYDASSRTITAKRDTTTVRLTVGSTTAFVNGQAQTLAAAPYIKNDRTMVPLRFVGEAFGSIVGYDPATTKIDIKDSAYPKRGGTLNLAMLTAPEGNFNPITVGDTYGQFITGLMYDGLWRYDTRYTPIPSIAEHWEWDSTNTKLTFYLRKDVRFHDGRGLTADDVLFTTKAMWHPKYFGARNTGWDDVKGYAEYTKGQGNGETAADFEAGIVTAKPVEGLYKLDDYTVVFELTKPNAIFVLQASIAPVDSVRYARIPVQDWGTARDPNNVFPNGTGSYKMGEYVEGQYAVLSANDDYFLGRPYINRVLFRIIAPDVAVGEMQKGTIDYSWFNAPDYDTYKTMENTGKVKIVEWPDMGYQLMYFNTTKGITADKGVRQAIAYAIDRQAIIHNLMLDHAAELHTPMHPLTFAYNDNVKKYNYDPARAKQMLDQAGWRMGNDGYRYKNGQKLKLSLMYPSPSGNTVRIRTAPVVQQWLKEIGIELELLGYDFGTLITKAFDEQNYDMFFIGWSLTADPDPTGLWDKASTVLGGNNPSGWWTERTEQLIKLGLSTPDIEQRMEYYAEFQEIFAEDLPALPLYAPNSLVVHSSRTQNVNPGPWGEFWNIEEWFLTN